MTDVCNVGQRTSMLANHVHHLTQSSKESVELLADTEPIKVESGNDNIRVRSFRVIWIRISDPRSLGSWAIKGADESMIRGGFMGSDHPKETHP